MIQPLAFPEVAEGPQSNDYGMALVLASVCCAVMCLFCLPFEYCATLMLAFLSAAITLSALSSDIRNKSTFTGLITMVVFLVWSAYERVGSVLLLLAAIRPYRALASSNPVIFRTA